MAELKDWTGYRFGRLTVIQKAADRNGMYHWLCKCDCGIEKEICIYHLKNGNTKSCGCLHKEIVRKKPYEALYNHFIRNNSLIRRIECNLTFEQFVEFTGVTNCYYCGEKIEWSKYNLHNGFWAFNLDRRNNNIGYVKENCVVCCGDCNYMKRTKTHGEFLEKIKRIYNKHCSNEINTNNM